MGESPSLIKKIGKRRYGRIGYIFSVYWPISEKVMWEEETLEASLYRTTLDN